MKRTHKILGMALFCLGCLSIISPAKANQVGDRVLGQWTDEMWYPARIHSIEGDAIDLNFDDGDISVVEPSQVRPIDWQEGTRVECNWQNGGTYYEGVIAKMEGDRIHIQYDDGDEEDATISRCRSK